MKFKNSILTIALVLVILIPLKVNAMEIVDGNYINRNGVIMDEKNYQNLSEKLTSKYVDFMTQKEYNDLKDHELPVVSTDSKILDSYDYSGLPIDSVSPFSTSGSLNGYQTASKKLTISIMKYETNEYYVRASNEWLKVPKTRSYDVFAMRPDDGFTMHETTQQGTQYYESTSGNNTILYQYNGANTVRKSNGFGMSMNLVDNSDITTFLNVITARVYGSKGTVSASYQHATSNVTKAQSMAYTLSVDGLGGCIMFDDYNVSYKYDSMVGVYGKIS